jgi:hypothetical protein
MTRQKSKESQITQAIKWLRKEYVREHLEGGMFCDINRGMCDSFAEDAQEFFPDAEVMETTQMLLDDHKRLALRGIRLLGDDEDEGFDYLDLMVDYKGHIVEFPTHYWVQYRGKHYDAEQPAGVKDWLNLPIFRRMRKRYNL